METAYIDRPRTRFPVIAGLFAAAIACFTAGRFGLLMALPVGYAFLGWPATEVGLFLAVRLRWIGVSGSAAGAALVVLAGKAGEPWFSFSTRCSSPRCS